MDLVDVAIQVGAWLDEGARVAVGWPVGFAGFSNLPPGDVVAVTDGGGQAGLVVGPAVTTAVAAELRAALATTGPWCQLVRHTVDDRAASAAGLSCGGTVTVALHHGPAVPPAFWAAVASGRPAAMLTRIPSDGSPVTSELLVGTDITGPAGPEPGPEVARELLAKGGPAGRVLAEPDGQLVALAVAPQPRLIVVGDGELALALTRQAALLGWRAEVRSDGPSALDAIDGLAPGHGVVVLSHDPEVGVPALAAALARGAGYVGALGSRGTQANRRGRLLRSGVDEATIDTIRGPAGLDLGGRAPEEIAMAICAEMLAVRSDRPGGPLRERSAPINS
jgi:xanthine dehydrogenase accessory factor